MQDPSCPGQSNQWKPVYLLAKVDKNSTTWSNIDDRVKNSLYVDDTSKIPFLDYHVTIYHMIINTNHKQANVFENVNFVDEVKQIYKNTFCAYPGLKLSSEYGKYDLFPHPSRERPHPFPQYFVRHYDLVQDQLDRYGVVERDRNGIKITSPSKKVEIVSQFRNRLVELIERFVGGEIHRSRWQLCPGYTIYSYLGEDIYAIPDTYHGPGVWEPHLSLFNTRHLKKSNNNKLFDLIQRSNSEQDKIDVLRHSMTQGMMTLNPISEIYFCYIPVGGRKNREVLRGDLPELTYSINFVDVGAKTSPPTVVNIDYRLASGQSPRDAYVQLNNSRVWVYGVYRQGQLGIGSRPRCTEPQILPKFKGVKQISCGNTHALILDKEGKVWGSESALLNQSKIDEFRPVSKLINVKQIEACADSSSVLDEFGQAWMFGSNIYRNLGLGDDVNRNVPTQIPGFKNIKQISMGWGHSAFIDEFGQVWTFGQNNAGKLGLGINAEFLSVPTMIPGFKNIKQVSCGQYMTAFIDSVGNLWVAGGKWSIQENSNKPRMIENFTGVVRVECGSNHIVFLDSTGDAWGWGDNVWGVLGPDFPKAKVLVPVKLASNIYNIATGFDVTGLITSTGSILIFGLLIRDASHPEHSRHVTIFSLTPGLIPRQISFGENFMLILE